MWPIKMKRAQHLLISLSWMFIERCLWSSATNQCSYWIWVLKSFDFTTHTANRLIAVCFLQKYVLIKFFNGCFPFRSLLFIKYRLEYRMAILFGHPLCYQWAKGKLVFRHILMNGMSPSLKSAEWGQRKKVNLFSRILYGRRRGLTCILIRYCCILVGDKHFAWVRARAHPIHNKA